MKSSILFLLACAACFSLCRATAATMVTFSKSVNAEIPDNNANGLVSTITLSTTGQIVTSIEVLLDVQQGWNGDLYAYVEHSGVISVLLNRPGRTAANPAGAASSGMHLRLVDSAPTDVHSAISGMFATLATGTYQPDARAADPALVTDTTPRSLSLSGFAGQAADGDWTLFVADLATGDVARLDNWSLSLTVIPEPSTGVLLLCAGLPHLLHRRRRCEDGGLALPHSPAASVKLE